MDPYNNAAFINVDTVVGGTERESRPSSEHRPRTLQKKRSFTETPTSYMDLQPGSMEGPYAIDRRGSIGLKSGAKARKGSLRYAVRRIFGRRSREGEPQPTPPLLYSPLEHAQVDAYGFVRTEHATEDPSQHDEMAQRTLSAPSLPPSSLPRPRSPYGFPHSARLKPLDLGNPFAATQSQMNRRKSMPSLIVNEADAATLSANIEAADVVVGMDADTLRAVETSIGARRHERRRSRSANDLRRAEEAQQAAKVSPRSQKEEMRRWRESLGGGVLRASGFTTRSPPRPNTTPAERQSFSTPVVARTKDSLDTTSPKITTPSVQRSQSDRDIGSASAFGTEISRDLEDRVSRLEAGLQSFRGQLAQLSADRNRRTILIGSTAAEPGSSSDYRSASMLATDLRDDLRPAEYQYEYTRARSRTTSSPAPPRTPTHTDPVTVTPNFSIRDRNMPDPFNSPSRRSPPTATPAAAPAAPLTTEEPTITRPRNPNNPVIPPHYTFRTLYEMLTDERSARRRLETQLKALQAEIANLHSQLAFTQSQTTNNPHSQRSSSYYYTSPMVGSSRLHALLQETDVSPPSTSHSSQQQRQGHDSGRFSEGIAGREDLTSRWSESEMGENFRESAYEVFRTPMEEQGRWGSMQVPRSSGEAEMF